MKALIIFVFLLPVSLFAQINRENCDDHIRSEAEKWDVPGVSVALVSSDSVLYEYCYGFSDPVNKTPVTRNTCFGLASATKSFTSLLCAMVLSEQQMTPDTRVSDIMPDFKMPDEYVTENLTIRDLLSHRSGLSRHNILRDNLSGSRSDFMHQLRYIPLSTGFRDRLSYSNLNYMILSGLLEHVTEKSWEELCESRILNPLHMDNTCCNILELKENGGDVAVPFIVFEDSTGPEPLDLHYEFHLAGAGNLVSDLDDMETWAQYQLSGKSPDGKPLIDERIRALLYRPLMAYYPSSYPETGDEMYAQGWFVSHYKGHKHLHHGGVLYGYTSLVSFLPDDDLAVVVLCNQNAVTHFTDIVSRYLYDLALGEEPTDWSARFEKRFEAIKAWYASRPDPEIEELPDPDKTEKYIGKYHNQSYGDIEVLKKDGKLVMKLASYDAELKHITGNQYAMVHPVSRAEFPVKFHQRENISFTAGFEPGLPDFEFSKQ